MIKKAIYLATLIDFLSLESRDSKYYRMNNKFRKIFLGLILVTQLSGFQLHAQKDELLPLAPQKEHPQSLFVVLSMLEQYHYRKLPLTDSLSSVIYDNYLSSLDPSKSFFLKSDVEYFERYRNQLDDQLLASKLDFGYQVFAKYRERALERYALVPQMLEAEFDFEINEYFETDYEKAEWSETRDELKEKWRLILKSQALSYRLADADRTWESISNSLQQRYDRQTKSIYQFNSEDVFQAYLNAVTRAFDPHTSYFSPITSENFQIEMSLSLEGIGARLSQQLDYTVVADVVPGGPAYKSKQLYKDDKIIGVAQGDDGEFIDVIGWRLDDVVQKIRGPKGTVVQLQILKKGDVNALPDTLRLVREKIKLEDEEAKAEIIPININNTTYNMGVISIPSFYIDFEERSKGAKDYKSTTADVKKLIDSLQITGIDGLLVDLRYNGGGSLQEAIDLTGLFIPRGPVVQVKNMDGSIDQMFDEDNNEVYYDGPLAVLNNRYSASASEIFSGAIQDYNRGVILGENSFGKGTVQNLIDLNRPVSSYLNRLIAYQQSSSGSNVEELTEIRNAINSNEIKLGQLKLTLAKFYRATGSSTQRLGVLPDIHFPSPFDPESFGESSRPNALPWDEIASAEFQPTNHLSEELRDHLFNMYLNDLSTDPQLKQLVQDVDLAKDENKITSVSLNIIDRRAQQKEQDTREKMSTEIDLGEITTSESTREKLKEDPYLKEGLRILAELAKSKMG